MYRARKLLVIGGLVILLASTAVGVALAKGDPVMATIQGPGLARSIEVTDPATLSVLNPWAGEFANWEDGPVAPATSLEAAYQVSIFTDLLGKPDELDLVYVFYYDPNFDGDWGLIYVPGPGETFYSMNIATIYAGRDGKWHPASRALDVALRPRLLERFSPPRNMLSEMLNISPAYCLVAIAVLLVVGAASLRRRRASGGPQR